MRAITGIVCALLALALSAISQWLLIDDAEQWFPIIVTLWTIIAGITLTALIWLYMQIALGPRSTVEERSVAHLERAAQALRNSRGFLFKGLRRRRLAKRAQALADRIEPAKEAHNVYARRVRLTNAVLALIAVLSLAFWVFASLGPKLWPTPFFTQVGTPDALHAALFSVDQITRGTMFDLFEVFNWNLSGLQNNPSNIVFSSLIIVYRLFVGGALVAALAVRFGMREDWRERVAREIAESMKERLGNIAAGR
jgi:hypothetical protein